MSVLKKNFGCRKDAVITQGDFVVSTINSETSFSFRMPAQGITIE